MSTPWNEVIQQVLATSGTSDAVMVNMASRESLADALPLLRAALEAQGYRLRFRTMQDPAPLKVSLWAERVEGSTL